MRGQAGLTLVKQISRSDPPGDQRPAKLNSERKQPARGEPAEGGDEPRPFSIAASGKAAGFRLPLLPRLAGCSCRWPRSTLSSRSRVPAGRVKSQVLSRAPRRTGADDLASRRRGIPAGGRAHSFAEGSKIVLEHLPDLQDAATLGRRRGLSVISFTLSHWGKRKGLRSSIKPAAIMAFVDCGAFFEIVNISTIPALTPRREVGIVHARIGLESNLSPKRNNLFPKVMRNDTVKEVTNSSRGTGTSGSGDGFFLPHIVNKVSN